MCPEGLVRRASKRRETGERRETAFLFVAAVVAVLAVAACGSDGPAPHANPSTLTDITGLVIGWQCGAAPDSCSLSPIAETPAPDPCGDAMTAGFDFESGRFFSICSVCLSSSNGWSTTPGQCRIVSCTSDLDCPVLRGNTSTSVFVCRNAICQNDDARVYPPGALKRFEVEELCFAVHDRSETTSLTSSASVQVEAEIDAVCPGGDALASCSVPAGCQAP
jgi:hypothetical protein